MGSILIISLISGVTLAFMGAFVFHCRKVSGVEDRRELSVSRSPASDAWVNFVGKFGVNDCVATADWGKEMNGNCVADFIKQQIFSRSSNTITGEMATGMTTVFRAYLMDVEQTVARKGSV